MVNTSAKLQIFFKKLQIFFKPIKNFLKSGELNNEAIDRILNEHWTTKKN